MIRIVKEWRRLVAQTSGIDTGVEPTVQTGIVSKRLWPHAHAADTNNRGHVACGTGQNPQADGLRALAVTYGR